MKSPVKSTSASRMFATGPAAIAATRFHVAARQYAFGPSASSRSSRLLRAADAACGRDLSLVDELAEHTHGVASRVVVTGREGASEAVRRRR